MRSFFTVIFFIIISTFCSAQNVKAIDLPALTSTSNLELKNLMEWLIDPAADAIWDSVSTIIDRNGTTNISPKNDAEWETLRQQAAVLTEAGNLLMMSDRVRPGKIWPLAAKKLKTSGLLALQATMNKDPDLLFKAGEEIYKSCAGCHHAYANFEKSTSSIPQGSNSVLHLSRQSQPFQFASH
ncbi:hypothetical protein [Polynucleobacter kasalickyi]|uniref:Cytochrome c domain-containing protein n=1 Tax=Polynucleobacter kasalickyi TaxID=1938817 RepID=A0A1W1Y4P7_9BURK|nr:hypothetical protein [Polynucleobacter kasalickyi]SMC30801.1 hypothetical protein SAMN06296008_101286 [Polynucleobacter kasalickyi]